MSRYSGSIAAFCVRRPVLAVVLNLLLIVAGTAAFLGVEVRELPNVDRPVVTIRTDYTGAAPQTVDTQITAVIEGAVARTPGVTSISSSSSRGSSRITVELAPSVDIDAAANDLRDAVARVQRRLPADADTPRVVKADYDGQAMMRIAATSATLPIEELSLLLEEDVIPRLSAVPGVADVTAWGSRRGIVSIEVDPRALAARGLAVEDVVRVVGNVQLDRPAGTLSGAGLDMLVRADASVQGVEQLARLPLGEATRLGDVATIDERPSRRSSAIRIDGQAGLGLGIARQPGSNTLEISSGVRRAVDELQAALPDGVGLRVISDDSVYIEGAIRQVVLTLLIATAIVVSVIWLFLRAVRTTVIPAIAVPVALIGTLASLWLMGFSINLLTLLALVITTGLVVDDAIVVIENIVRRRRLGLGPRAAAVLGTRQVFFAVLATTATLAAVFIPISFLPGTAGGLFREFGFVLAVAVALSSFVALTLVPMLASRLGDDVTGAGEAAEARRSLLARLLDRIGTALATLYDRVLALCLKAPLVVLVVAVLFAAAAARLYDALPEELTPREDRGTIFVSVSAPQSSSLPHLEAQMAEAEDAVMPLLASGEADSVFLVAGSGGRSNTGFMVVRLAPWGERRDQHEIMAELMPALNDITGASVSARSPNSLGIRGGGTGLRFALTGTSYEQLSDVAEVLVAAMRERMPDLQNPSLDFDTTQPQIAVQVDREAAADLGVDLAGVSVALQGVLDGVEVGEIFHDDLTIPIWLQAAPGTVSSPIDLESVQIRAAGGMVPLSAIAEVTEAPVAPSLARESQRRAVPLSAGLGEAYDLRRAMTEVQALAAEVLPPGVGLVYLGEAATLDETSSALLLTAAFALVVVLLVLAAQFESVTHATIVIATVPFGIAAALVAMTLTGGSLNIYSQIGLILLVGLMAKNGILIVEFANQLRDQGRSVEAAIREACAIRLRPVAMTLISTVLGGLPLVLGTGPGAEARAALGWIIVGGLGLSTLFTLFLTPVVYRLLAGFSKPRSAEQRRLERELAGAIGEPLEEGEEAPPERPRLPVAAE
jgi:hydrophobic/amphiphilic exporter-1 (mainly G- bacteria), HAE1 family